jgi:IS5 family transposase
MSCWVKKKGNQALRGRCDSFVVETHVHYPTDIHLLFDAVRKVIQLTAHLCTHHHVSDWRQHAYNVKQVKRQMRIAQQTKRYSGQTPNQKMQGEKRMRQAHRELIKLSDTFLNKMESTLANITNTGVLKPSDLARMERIRYFANHAYRQMDQINRRVLQGEPIPHEEKVFSLFQPHTEWVAKGKVGVAVELGLRVCVLEDQHQFILHHRVMQKETDSQVAIPMVKASQSAFPRLTSCSFDKGFHSPENQHILQEQLNVVALKRKGKLSQQAQRIESSPEFKTAHHKHAAVESAINALEVHGLDRCRDHGIDGFKRYVALAIVARNIHRIGDMLHKKAQARAARQRNRCRDGTFALAT